MSEISEAARVSLVLADYANADAANKLNIIGAGVSMTGIDPQTGQTPAICVVVMSTVPAELKGHEYALEIALYGDDGELVRPPGPVEAPPIRVARMVTIEPVPTPAGGYLPADTVWPTAQVILNFQTGLPIAAGGNYEWRVSIDQNVVATAQLYVVGAPPVTYG